MTYEAWRESQEAKGFVGGMSTAAERRIREMGWASTAQEGMIGYVDSEGTPAVHRDNLGTPDRGIIPLDDIFGTATHWERKDK